MWSSFEIALSGFGSYLGIKLHAETARRATEISSIGKSDPQRPMTSNLEDFDHDVFDVIMSFVGIHAYLSIASVSTRWRHSWGERPRVTSLKWAVHSCSCLDWARACGLTIKNKPSLLAAAQGRLDVLQHAVALGYSREGMPICERAAAGGHLEVVKWCRANGYPWGLSKLRAAEGGHLDVLQWCIASHAPDSRDPPVYDPFIQGINMCGPGTWETRLLNGAAEGGHLETVIWCTQQGYEWSEDTCYLAAKEGHLELLRWLRNKGCPWSEDTMAGAARADDLKMLEWCREKGCPWNENVELAAAWNGNLEILEWCVANGLHGGLEDWIFLYQAERGHLEVVQWLRGMGYAWGESLCFLAACGGHFELLKWCRANGCPWDDVPHSGTGFEFHGTVPMMVWATANGCQWMDDPSAVNSLSWHAARGGNLEVLKWCGAHRMTEDTVSLKGIVLNGHAHVLEWLRTNSEVLDSIDGTTLCEWVVLSGSLETVKWCWAHDYPWCQNICAAAASSGNLEVLQWVRSKGCPWDKNCCRVVIHRGDFEMLAWCRENGCPPEKRWRETSLWSGHEEMIEWCWESSPTNRRCRR